MVMRSGPEIIYESSRHFEVWTWGAGHRGLTLLSHPASGQRSRIEAWFKPAYAASLRSYLEGIQIIRDSAGASAYLAVLGRPIKPWEELFTVRSGKSLGWVIAGGVHGREYDHDEQDHSGPASLGTWEPKPGERRLFSANHDS
jgi:hypothetical protein